VQDLAWLGDDLVPLLLTVRARWDDGGSQDFRSRLGRAGELLVAEVERAAGQEVTVVSEVSDYYGYDVESRCPVSGHTRCLEVKTTLNTTDGSFYISRHEAETAEHLADRWFLIQAILNGAEAREARYLEVLSVAEFRTMPGVQLLEMLPDDTEYSSWNESAKVAIPTDLWSPYESLRAAGASLVRPIPNPVLQHESHEL
jgi:hypothetical protein